MDLREMVVLIKKRQKLLIFIVLVAFLTNSILNLFILDRVYASTITFMVNRDSAQGSKNLEYEDILLGEKLVDAYSIIAKGDGVLEGIIDKLDLDTSIKKLKEQIIIMSKPEKRIIEVTLEDKDPEQSLEKARAFINIFQENINELFHVNNIQVINRPKYPEVPIRPKVGINLLISFFSGSIVGFIVILILELLDNGVKGSKEIEKHLNIPLLASIPKWNPEHSIIEDVQEKTLEYKYKLEDAFMELVSKLNLFENDESKTILLTTTLQSIDNTFVKELSLILSGIEKKILILDCNLMDNNLYEKFELERDMGFIDLLKEHSTLYSNQENDLDYKKYIRHISFLNIDVLFPGYGSIKDRRYLISKKFRDLFMELKMEYDVIIINGSSLKNQTETITLAKLSEEIILLEEYRQSKINHIETSLEKLGNERNKVIGIVINNRPYT